MEEILSFVLGVSAVAFVWVVVVAFKTASKVRELEKAISQTQDWINQKDQLVNRRIDQEVDRVDLLYTKVLSILDSRIDKLEAKLLSVDKDGCEPTKKLIKG